MLRRMQAVLQWCFLKVEALFNLAFGDRLNPLYYLGPNFRYSTYALADGQIAGDTLG